MTPSFPTLWHPMCPYSAKRPRDHVRRYSSRSQRHYLAVENAMIVQSLSNRPSTSGVRVPSNTLRQIYGPRCEITLLGEEAYYSTSRPSSSSSAFYTGSTTTSSGQYGRDLLYGGDVEKTSVECRLGQSSLVDLDQVKDGRREHRKQHFTRDSLNTDSKGNIDRDIQPNGALHHVTNPKVNQFKPNGLRNSLVTKGRSSQDEMVAMGTIFSPNVQQKPLRTFSVCANSNSSSSSVAPPRRVSSVAVTSGPYKNVLSLPNAQQTSRSLTNSIEPKYSDPLLGAPPQFQQRLAELSTLEADTVRYEKTRKLKRKPTKQDRDS